MPLTRFLVVVAVVIGVSGCESSSSPTGPSTTAGPLNGTWAGTLTRAGATQTLRLVLTDTVFGSGSVSTGTYAATDSAGTSTGSVGGIALNGVVSFTLKPSVPPVCPTGSTLTVAPGDMLLSLTLTGQQMSGQAVIVQCAAEALGTVTLAR